MKKFYFLFIAMMLGLVANAADYYLIGGFNGWALKQEKCKFTDAGDGTYVLDYQGTLTSGFKINDGTWGDVDFGGAGVLTIGQEYTLVKKGGNISMNSNIDNPHIVLNPEAMTLLITGQAVEAKVRYGIHGQIFGNQSWETVDMEKGEDGKWSIMGDLVPGEFGIKVMDEASGSQTDWYSSADESNTIGEEQLGVALNVKSEGSNWVSSISGAATLTFDPEAMTLTITTGDSGVENVEINSNAVEVARYSIDGREISEPQKGVNIIRYSNGVINKVIVK